MADLVWWICSSGYYVFSGKAEIASSLLLAMAAIRRRRVVIASEARQSASLCILIASGYKTL